MSEKRRDSRGRILHNGEMQMSDGRYRYRSIWIHLAKRRLFIVGDLTIMTECPLGKRSTPSLREMEKQIQADMFDHIVSNGGNLTVYDLVEKYVSD